LQQVLSTIFCQNFPDVKKFRNRSKDKTPESTTILP
jgi:hypothetical protein